jgi:putative ABC transport system permease protein
MSDFFADLRYAVRGLLRRPGFAVAAVLLLGIGIGASSVLLTLARATFAQQPPGVTQPERLVRLNRTSEGVSAGSLSYPDYEFYRDGNHTLSGLAAYDRSPMPIMARTGGTRTQVNAGLVSGEYFVVLGVQPALGRLMRREDDRGIGGPRVAVISHDLWMNVFGGRPDAVGAELTLGAEPFQVIGVAPAGFRGASLAEGAPDVWVPITLQPLVAVAEVDRLHRVSGQTEVWIDAVGRLRPGVAVAAAQADLSALAVRLEREFAEWDAGNGVRVSPDVRYHPNLRRRIVRVMELLGAATATILTIACLNVALLLLARGAARGREMGIRRAIGARQWRIVRQLLTEGLVIAGAGAVVGVIFAVWISGTAGAALFAGLTAPFQTDLGVLGLTALVAVASVVVFALGPAVVATRPTVVNLLKAAGGSRGGARLRAGLVVTQIALSLALVTAAGLLVRSILGAQAVDPGFTSDRQLLVSVDLERSGYTPERG